MKRSLHSSLLICFAMTLVTGFIIAGAAIFALIRTSLLNEFDTMLGSKIRTLAALFELSDNKLSIEFVDHPLQEFSRENRPEYFQAWDDNDIVLARSERLAAGDLKRATGSPSTPSYQFVTLPDGRPGRQATVQFLPTVDKKDDEQNAEEQTKGTDEDDLNDIDFISGQSVALVVARETAEIDRALAQLGWLMFGVSSAVVAIALGAVAWLVKRSLRPLEALAKQIDELNDQELTARFHVNDAPREIDPIILRLNELLIRLEETFQRERLFSANVAHELRTPLTGLRSTLEVTLRQERHETEYRQTLEDCEAIVLDTQRLVETLLSLARIESRQAVLDREEVDVEKLMAKCWKPLLSKAKSKGLQVCFDGPSGILIRTDADKLQIALAILLDNAVEYSEQNGSIEIRWGIEMDRLCLTFVNSGCNLNDEQVQRVFDRFWRADSARSETGSHAGLGLALCKKIILLLDGTITVESRQSNFVVTLGFASVGHQRVGLAG